MMISPLIEGDIIEKEGDIFMGVGIGFCLGLVDLGVDLCSSEGTLMSPSP
jgi:hypothetical protein